MIMLRMRKGKKGRKKATLIETIFYIQQNGADSPRLFLQTCKTTVLDDGAVTSL
jgi:hypothetical protein